jgi:surface antigen
MVVLGALSASGCSYRLLSLTSKDDTDTPTGSIRPAARTLQGSTQASSPGAVPAIAASPPSADDLTFARAAASDVLARGSKDASVKGESVPWENPQTGAGGNITPLATAYSEGGLSCRDFLTSYVHGGSHDWLQGAACRDAHGVWEVKRLKPLGSS